MDVPTSRKTPESLIMAFLVLFEKLLPAEWAVFLSTTYSTTTVTAETKANGVPCPVSRSAKRGETHAGVVPPCPSVVCAVAGVEINGQPGAQCFDAAGCLINVLTLDITGGTVHVIRSIVKPGNSAASGHYHRAGRRGIN